MLILDHIAVLTRSLSKVAAALPPGLERHEVESFPSEGTKEQYISLPGFARILLLEAISDGPYQRTLQKRGAGLHHFCCITDDLNASVAYFSVHGLLLHSVSLKTFSNGVVWMCRPGIPFLIELSESDLAVEDAADPIEAAIPNLEDLILWVPGIRLSGSKKNEIVLHSGGDRVAIENEPA